MKSPSPHFNINQYIQFSNHSTRATSAHKLTHCFSFTSHQHSFFSRIIRLWNSVPVIDLSLPTDIIKKHLTIFFWEKFSANFTSDHPCSFHLVCPCYCCTKLPITMCLHSLLNYTIYIAVHLLLLNLKFTFRPFESHYEVHRHFSLSTTGEEFLLSPSTIMSVNPHSYIIDQLLASSQDTSLQTKRSKQNRSVQVKQNS